MSSTAIYIPVCRQSCPCHKIISSHHLTLVHLKTKDKKIIQLAKKKIRDCIKNNYFLNVDSQGNKIASYQISKISVNSIFFKGNIEEFKKSLYDYLNSDTRLSPYLNSYRAPHVDQLGFINIPFYPQFRVENLKVYSR